MERASCQACRQSPRAQGGMVNPAATGLTMPFRVIRR
jgi:hypothetical protein